MEKADNRQEETDAASARPKHKPEKKISFVSESVYEAEMAKHEKAAIQKEDDEFRKKNEKEASIKEDKNIFIKLYKTPLIYKTNSYKSLKGTN